MNVRAAVTIGIAVLIVSPLALRRGWDDFPISSYPMFSRGTLGTVENLAHALVVHADGTRSPASPALVGTPEPMVANAIVLRAINRGTTAELCTTIAARAPEGTAIEIAVSTYDTKTYFAEKRPNGPDPREPLARTVHARCDVKRP